MVVWDGFWLIVYKFSLCIALFANLLIRRIGLRSQISSSYKIFVP